MCGIAGIVKGPFDSKSRLEVVRHMAEELRHRGPDSSGDYADEVAALAHRRLEVIDLTAAAAQPFRLGSLWLVYNGEIYNHRALRQELEAAGEGPFHSTSDTEVVLRLFRRHAAAAVEKLIGMFAFAIWDSEAKTLFAARDRLGIKPFAYRLLPGGGLAFASEVNPLAHPELDAHGGSPDLDRAALVDFFRWKYVPSPHSIWQGVTKLPPAHTLTLAPGDSSPTLRRYWQPVSTETTTDAAVADARFDELFSTVVSEHTMSDVPLGVFLSGGLDSSSIAASMAGESGERAAIETFTLGFDVGSHDEAQTARETARFLGTKHHEEHADGPGLDEALSHYTEIFDEPFGDHGAWPMARVARLARRNVTVALSGEGGDELFAGYPWYTKFPRFKNSAGASLLARGLPAQSKAARSAARRSAREVERYAYFLGPFTQRQIDGLLHPDLLAHECRLDRDPWWHARRFWRHDLSPIKRLQWADLHTYLVDDMLTKVDRASMWVSLEARPPFVDHRLVEFALGLHPELMHGGSEGKLITRRWLAGRVPQAVLTQRKIGFSMPVMRWVRRRPELLRRALDRLHDRGVLTQPGGWLRHQLPFTNEQAWCLLVLDRFFAARNSQASL